MSSLWDDFTSSVGSAATQAGNFLTTGTGNKLGNLALGLGAGYLADKTGLLDANIPQVGYQGDIPDYTAVRERVDTDPERRTGGRNQRYFTDLQFAENPNTSAPSMTQAQAQAAQQRKLLEERNKLVKPMATGGITNLSQGRYLSGSTDGMADVVPARIDGGQEARLSDGEFVIPADVVSHLGNGNSDAGAKQLHGMMDNVRMARTGKKAQGTQINPDKFMPKMAQGGIAKFSNGTKNPITGTNLLSSAAAKTTDSGVNQVAGKESSLSSYVGPYVTEMLGRGQALASQPYQEFQGPLTAGTTPLQQKAFEGIGALQTPTMGAFTPTTFGTEQATQYMNPYLMTALQPQIDEARRQAEIQRVADAGRLTRAGAFGGSRQAVMEAEGRRGLADRIARITGEGYRDAFNRAQQQFNVEQEREKAAQQMANQYGFEVLGGFGSAGAKQRAIEQQGLSADMAQFEEERDFPYKQVQYMQSLLQGLPLEAQSVQYSQPSTLSQILTGTKTIDELVGNVGGLGDLFGLNLSGQPANNIPDNTNPSSVPVTDLSMTTQQIDNQNQGNYTI